MLDDGFVVDEPCAGLFVPLSDDSEPEGLTGVVGVVSLGLPCELSAGLLGVVGLDGSGLPWDDEPVFGLVLPFVNGLVDEPLLCPCDGLAVVPPCGD